ncbi:hypothetical protein F5Y15DRAFT_365703 [Xylariaceae sp. FL0016]|nr:hypothetical protein F5Y15DRAFT_365703 [Xylariaceae sp. FL0016]
MHPRALLLAPLATLGLASPIPAAHDSDELVCTRAEGHYSICDTIYSFMRCSGYKAAMVVDCVQSPQTYCRMEGDQAKCDGTTPPPLNGTLSESLGRIAQ